MSEPKTLVAPEDFVMLNIVPQHVTNPLYIANATFSELRREFLLDHILLDPVDLTDKQLNTKEGLRMMTFSGKDLIFRFDNELGKINDIILKIAKWIYEYKKIHLKMTDSLF